MRKLLVALGVTFVVLLGTGLHQTVEYQPAALRDRPDGSGGALYDVTAAVHLLSAWLFGALVVAIVAVWVARRRGAGRWLFIGVVVVGVLVLATVAEMLTGGQLKWTSAGLHEVVRDLTGVFAFRGVDGFVRAGGTTFTASEYTSRAFLHVVLFPIGLALVGGVLWFLSVRDDRRAAALAGSPSASDGNDDTDLDDDFEGAPT